MNEPIVLPSTSRLRPSIAAGPTLSRKAILALYAAAIVVLADMYLTQPILPVLSQEFGISPATAGLSISVMVLVIALASTSSGPLGDALGRKRIMVGSCLLLAIPTLLCAVAPSFPALLLFRAVQGALIPGLTAVAVAYFGERVAPDALGGVVGGWIAANVAGGLIGRISSGVITDLFGWRAAFVCFAAITLLCAVTLALVLPADIKSDRGGWRKAYRGMFSHLRNRQLVGAFIIAFGLFFGFIGVFTYLPYYLTSAPFNLPSGIVAFAYISYIAGVIISPLAGRWSQRWSRRGLMGVGIGVAIAGMILTLIPSVVTVVISLFVITTGMFMAQAVAPAFVNVTARQAKGGAGALYLMFYYLGGTFGGVLPGLAWQHSGWIGIVLTCVGAMIVALLAACFLCGPARNDPAQF